MHLVKEHSLSRPCTPSEYKLSLRWSRKLFRLRSDECTSIVHTQARSDNGIGNFRANPWDALIFPQYFRCSLLEYYSYSCKLTPCLQKKSVASQQRFILTGSANSLALGSYSSTKHGRVELFSDFANLFVRIAFFDCVALVGLLSPAC